MFKVTAVSLHAATQTFSPLINSAVDDRLLHTAPCSNQKRVRYTNK